MFRIRRIFDDMLTVNRNALDQVSTILKSQFHELSQANIDRIPDLLRDPLKYNYRSVAFVAEGRFGKVQGFGLFSYDPGLNFYYLDYIASERALTGRGIGGALYQRIREEAFLSKATGVFFESLPDDPNLCKDPVVLEQNRARLRFYETYGARPIINTAYETPVTPGGDNPPYLVFDGLGQEPVLRKEYIKKVMAWILERKYSDVCSPEYIKLVVDSVQDDPVCLRALRYRRNSKQPPRIEVSQKLKRIALVINDRHEIHHVRERGYVEAPVRIRTILTALGKTGLFDPLPPEKFEDKWITSVHDPAYVKYFKRVCEVIEPTVSVYPYVFPIRNHTRPPMVLPVRAGYYCIDTFTPISRNAYLAARRAVDCVLTAAREILAGRRLAYALVRPPGHHAERGFFGGFCYFNNAAVAANYLCRYGKVAILDIDYHHGNGQQAIFYQRNDILTISIHGHPRFAYPYFSGFSDERGEGPGLGFNVNYPLPEEVNGQQYLEKLEHALNRVRSFKPVYLVVCLGLDTAKGDPTGSWSLKGSDFNEIGKRIASLRFPCLIVQEGGYNNRSLGTNAAHFFRGLLPL